MRMGSYRLLCGEVFSVDGLRYDAGRALSSEGRERQSQELSPPHPHLHARVYLIRAETPVLRLHHQLLRGDQVASRKTSSVDSNSSSEV